MKVNVTYVHTKNKHVYASHLCPCTIAVSDILFYIGVISSVVIFPIGIFILILCSFCGREKGNIVILFRRESAYMNFVNISIYSQGCVDFSWYCRISDSISLRTMFTLCVILLLSWG